LFWIKQDYVVLGLGIAASIGVLLFLENRKTLDGAASVPGMIYQGTENVIP
jgi:hypothetical protein